LLVTQERREKYPCFIAAPQYPGKPPLEHWGQVVTRGLLLDMIRFVEMEYSIDSKRIYVTGISNGGVGTFAALTRHPKIFAAAVPVCGGGAPDLAEKFATVPIWVFHGAKDDVIPVGKSREMVAALRAAGGKPKYTEFPDAGHDIVEQTYNNDELFEWLFAQKRE
jgi:predicted peptidase